MTGLKSIEEQWQQFAAKVFRSINPGPGQVEDMKRSFYAGAFVMLLSAERIGEPDISESAGMRYLESCRAECESFFRAISAHERN